MSRLLSIPILFSLLATPLVVYAQQGAAEEVKKLERAWLDAYEKLDQKAMDQIVADDFSITFPNGGMQNKAQILASLKAPAGASQTSSKFHTEDVRARVYGDTVIMTGRVISEWWRDGKIAGKETSRYTDTYVKRDGRWQVVASHLSNTASP
jgi:ketosteroid isomerase-like protein